MSQLLKFQRFPVVKCDISSTRKLYRVIQVGTYKEACIESANWRTPSSTRKVSCSTQVYLFSVAKRAGSLQQHLPITAVIWYMFQPIISTFQLWGNWAFTIFHRALHYIFFTSRLRSILRHISHNMHECMFIMQVMSSQLL